MPASPQPPRNEEPKRVGRYRLDVVAESATHVIDGIGGLLVDYAMAGWEVRAIVEKCGDDRPLHILGATAAQFDAELSPSSWSSPPDVLAVSVDVYERRPQFRLGVMRALDCGATVYLWGSHCPAKLLAVSTTVPVRCSRAGDVFASHAQSATGNHCRNQLSIELFQLCQAETSGGGRDLTAQRLRHRAATSPWRPLINPAGHEANQVQDESRLV